MIIEKACPKCRSTVQLIENEERVLIWKCFACGKETSREEMEKLEQEKLKEEEARKAEKLRLETLAPPPRPDLTGLNKLKRNMAIHRYYEENKAAILAQIARKGELQVKKDWGIPSGTMSTLKYHWGLPVKTRRKKTPQKDVVSSKMPQPASESPMPLITVKLTVYIHPNERVKVMSG